MDKKEPILSACEKVLNGIEDSSLSGTSALLICKKIARLTEDDDAMMWLDFEAGGYKRTPDGKRIDGVAFDIGFRHGRGLLTDNQKRIFVELISELENTIEANLASIKCFTTDGVSVSGDSGYVAMNRFVSGVQGSISSLNENIKECSRKRSILLNEYYNYAHSKQVEMLFGDYTKSIFERYQNQVNNYFNTLNKDLILKMAAIQKAMNEDNPESFSQALTTCRKLFVEIAKDLFAKVLPNHIDVMFKTNSGKEIDVSGDHTINQLSAVIETLENKASKNTIVGSNVIYVVDWLDALNNSQSKGVHHTISREEADRCIIQTYISLANIISLYLNNV